MRFRGPGLVLAAGLLAMLAMPVMAQDGFAEFQAAVAREKEAAAAFEVSRARAARFEDAAVDAALGELTLREEQSARLAEIDSQLARLVDNYVFAGERSPLLLRELDVLEHWYATYSPVALNLTPRSFLGLEVELGGLAAAGLIYPGERSFTRLADVRSAIQQVNGRLGELRRTGDSERARLAREMDVLERERDALLGQVATENAASTVSADQWLDAALAAGRAAAVLFAAQDAVLAAYERYAQFALRQRPPSLVDVAVSQDGGRIYKAGWVGVSGTAGDDAARRSERDRLAELRQQLIEALEYNRAERRDLAAGRLELAERMMPRSRALEASAQRYSELRWNAAVGALALDIGFSVAEIALTGGTATLVRKTEQLVAKTAERAAARQTVHALIEAATPAERAVIRLAGDAGDPLSESLRLAARRGEAILNEKAPALIEYLVGRGMGREQAARQVEQVVAGTLQRLRTMDQLSQMGNRAAAELPAAERALAALGMQLPTYSAGLDREVLVKMLHEELRTKGVGQSHELAAKAKELVLSDGRPPDPVSLAVREIETQTGTFIGEAIETGFTVTANTVTARAADGLSGMAKYGSKFGRGIQANAANLGIGLVSSAIEVAAAGQFDQLVNAEVKNFVRAMAELDALYRIYVTQLQMDQALAGNAAVLAGALAALDQRIADLDGGYSAAPRVASAGKAEGNLQLELTFSAPLTAAPAVTVGSVAVPVNQAGGDGRVWIGTVSARTVGPGTHTVDVAIDRNASPHGALDADPATPAKWSFARRGWAGFEAGPDRSHSIRLEAPQPEVADLCPGRMPGDMALLVCSCPAESGGGAVWGTYYYTDDSSICPAARHAGAVTTAGGEVRVRREPGRNYYTGTTANGVESGGWGGYGGTLVFEGTSSPEQILAEYEFCGGSTVSTAGERGPQVCRCPIGASGAIWGSGPYTSDSNICHAAIHSGVLTAERGGLVTVYSAPGQDSYAASTRNGVTTMAWGGYGSSFTVGPVAGAPGGIPPAPIPR